MIESFMCSSVSSVPKRALQRSKIFIPAAEFSNKKARHGGELENTQKKQAFHSA